jgi:glycosyltransferase involved in cell wall biosynthesis
MMHPTISVIIPAYNAEKYIVPCVESILNQGDVNLEIVIVNDGSKDNTHQVCLELAAKHPEINYFRKENGGANAARRYGLSKITGDYVAFCDSDDTFPANVLPTMLRRVIDNDLDIYLGCSYDFTLDGRVSFVQHNKISGILSGKEYCEGILRHKIIYGSVSKLLKRSAISDSDFNLPRDIVFNEDVFVNISTGLKAKRVGVYNDLVVYNYYIGNTESVCHTLQMSEDSWLDLFRRLMELNQRNGGIICNEALYSYFETKIRGSYYNRGYKVKDRRRIRNFLFNRNNTPFRTVKSMVLYLLLTIPMLDNLYICAYRHFRLK